MIQTDKPVKLSLNWTNKCFHKALTNLGLTRETYPEHREKVAKEYLRLVRALPSHMLETMIQENIAGVVRREDSTIAEILDELAYRILIRGENETHIKSNAQ